MKKNILIIADKPNFYKTNLFNRLNNLADIYVIYVGEEKIKRDKFFYSNNMEFEYYTLSGNKLQKIIQILKIIKRAKPSKIVVAGWDNIYYVLVLLLFKASVIVESTSDDKDRTSIISKIKYLIKKLILSKVEEFLCAGYKHERYVKSLYKNKKTVVTKTVGFPFDNIKMKKILIKNRKDFVFIGRNSSEKNIDFMIDIFQKSELSKNDNLVLVGDTFEKYKFHSFIKIYEVISRENMVDLLKNFRALVLLSKSEPYGLVIEEALRCNIPVICSDKCGIVDTLIFDGINGVVLNIKDEEESIIKINNFLNLEKKLVESISNMDFEKMDEDVVRSFVE